MANPFEVTPANPLQALMMGVQGYDRSVKATQESDMRAGRLEAAQTLQQGGDVRPVLAKLMGIGDIQGAKAIADYAHSQAQEKLAASSQANTQAYQNASLGIQRDHLGLQRQQMEQGKITRGVIQDPMGGPSSAYEIGPNGYRVLPTIGAQSAQAPGGDMPAPQQSGAKPDAAALMQKYGGKPDDGRDWNFLASLPTSDAQEKVLRLTQHDLNPVNYSTRIAPGSGMSARDAITTAAAKFDKTYNQQDYPNIQASRLAFDKGTQGNTVRSLNVLADHTVVFRDLGEALHNGNIPLFNSIANKVADMTGGPAPRNFSMAAGIIGTELTKALGVAGAGTAEERAAIGQKVSNASSPAQMVGIIDQVVRPMVAGQLRGLRQQYTTSTKRSDEEFNQKLFPSTRSFLEGAHSAPQQAGGGGISEGATATGPGGQRIQMRGGQWVPMQ